MGRWMGQLSQTQLWPQQHDGVSACSRLGDWGNIGGSDAAPVGLIARGFSGGNVTGGDLSGGMLGAEAKTVRRDPDEPGRGGSVGEGPEQQVPR